MSPTADYSEDADVDGLEPEARAAVAGALAQSAELLDEMSAALLRANPQTLTLDEFLELRAHLGHLNGQLNRQARVVTKQYGIASGIACVREFLIAHPGEVYDNNALSAVACIVEWARRGRELRVQHGYAIVTGKEHGLKRGQYRLDQIEANRDSAEDWSIRNGIRRRPGSAQSRILALLQAKYPEPVHRDDLDYVAKIRSRDRRTRNLEEAGWQISGSDDDPSIASGYYQLDSLEQGPPRSREALKLRMEILKQAAFTCELCGAQPTPTGPRIHLQVHHRVYLIHGGDDRRENLQVLCRPCHSGVHALEPARVRDELLEPSADPYATHEGAAPPQD